MPQPIIKENTELNKVLAAARKIVPNTIPLSSLVNAQGYVPIERLIERLNSLQPNTTADLSNIPLHKISEKDLHAIFNALSPNLLELNLSDTHLGELPAGLLLELFKKLPRTLIHLHLGTNTLDKIPAQCLSNILKTLPPLVRLDLHDNNLAFDYQITRNVLNCLSRTLLSLNYSGNNLNHLDFIQLNSIFAEIMPKGLLELDLSGCLQINPNTLQVLTVRALNTLFFTNPFFNLVKMNLDSNQLGKMGYDDVKNLLTHLPRKLTSLGLKHNLLGDFNAQELIALLRCLPQDLQTLDLSENNLGTLQFVEWIEFFKSLPKPLVTLKLSKKDIEHLSPTQLFKLLNAAPAPLKTLYIDDQVFNVQRLKRHLLLQLIEQEVTQLDADKNTVLLIMGLTSYPKGEIIAFNKLKPIIELDESEFRQRELKAWHKEFAPLFTKSKSKTNAFFTPEKRSEQLLNDIYSFLQFSGEPQATMNSTIQ